MSVDVSTSVIINRPRALVSSYAANPDNAPEWYTWETTSDGATRMTLRNRGTPTGFSRWLNQRSFAPD
jgi:hypothetical protein